MNDEIRAILLQNEIGHRVLSALEVLIDRERHLFEQGVNERSLTHKFACYLQQNFPDWNVDCEYNRDGHDPKELYLPELHPDPEDSDAQTVFPDVIVHRRGEHENLLVIEFKKNPNVNGRRTDLIKLRHYKGQLGYLHALFVGLGVRPNPTGISEVRWVD